MRNAILMLSLLTGFSAFATDYYWVGNAGNWSDYANHWVTTSGGSTFHTQAPTSADDVYFDANSFTLAGQSVVMDVSNSDCRLLDWSAVTNTPNFSMPGFEILRVHRDVIFSPNMTLDLGVIELKADAGNWDITTGGIYWGDNAILRQNGAATFNLDGELMADRLQIMAGTFNTNDHTLSMGFSVSMENGSGNAKTINLGASELHAQQWRTYGSNNTINAGTSVFYISSMYADEGGTGPYTYNDIVLTNDSGILEGGGTFNSIDITSIAGGELRVESGATFVFNSLSGASTRNTPFHIYATTSGQQATLSMASGSVDLEYAILQDIAATGGASFNVENAVDEGGNTGWNLTALEPWDFYWIGNGGDWEDPLHWSSTSGGAADYDVFPSQFDHVFFDANSFSQENQTVAVNQLVSCTSIDCTGAADGVTDLPNLTAGYGNAIEVYGGVNMGSMNKSVHSMRFYGIGTHTVDFGTEGNVSYPSFWGTGDYTMLSDIDCASISIVDGTFDLNGYNANCQYNFSVSNSNSQTVNLGSGEIHCLRWQMNSSNAVVNTGTSHVFARGEFKGNGYSYYEVTLEEEVVVYASNAFELLHFAPNGIITLPANETQTVNTEITAAGAPDAPISINSSVDGQQAVLNLASGTVNGSYLVLKDNAATGGATFNAAQSIDNGNNSGWNITEPQPQTFYWVGGTGNWTDAANHWSSTSGGAPDYTFAPGVLDDVIFDANSFSAADQVVTVDAENINCHDFDASAVTNSPTLDFGGTTMNLYGSLTLSPNVTFDATNFNLNLLSPDPETLDFANADYPGTASYIALSSGGDYDLTGPLKCRELNIEGGALTTNGFDLHVDFHTQFSGEDFKTIDYQGSTYFTRMINWGSTQADNLTIEGTGGILQVSSSFSPDPGVNFDNINLTFDEVEFVLGSFTDNMLVYSSVYIDQLTIEPGKTVNMLSSTTLEVGQLIAAGTAENPIIFQSQNPGQQTTISQASGTVNGDYLELKDIAATGGATFYANNSVDLGNVTGWIFTGQAQSIAVDPVDDVMEDVGTVTLTATASSGLPVAFALISGPATLAGDVLTITGPGLVVVEASQGGDDTFNPAPVVSIEFCANPLQPVITGTPDEVNDWFILASSANLGNQWFLDGATIGSGTGSVYTAVEDGIYTVMVDVDGCVSALSDGFEVTGVFVEGHAAFPLNIYPNPAGDFLTVERNGGSGTLAIRALDGQLVREVTLHAQQSRINLTGLPRGSYVLIFTRGTQVESARLIKH